jgi:hypothetical protein
MTEERDEMGKTFTALVRVHEANCRLEFPSPEEQNFRIAIMKKIGLSLNLAEVRQTQISGPAKGLQRPQKTVA